MSENLPAFPCVGYGPLGHSYRQEGMTLRDWFAGQALAGFLSDGSQRLVAAALAEDENFHLIQDARAKASVVNVEIAEGCYALADAMLLARLSALRDGEKA